MKPIRVLFVVPNLRVCNGVATYTMNYFRNMNKEKIKIDFLLLNSIPTPYYDEIRQAGSNIKVLPPLKDGILKYLKALDSIFDCDEKYDIIHCNVINAGALILKYAKKNGIKVRILHSHATKSAEQKIKEIRNNIIAPITKHYSTDFFSCSKLAGDYLFGKSYYHIVNNAIDESKYIFDNHKREIVRNKFNIDKNFVVGTVGRFAPQKNPLFLVEIFFELKKKCNNAKLLWVGSGFMEKEVKQKVDELNLNNDVLFLGDRSDVQDLYQAMDVFLLPSIYEGLPLVGIEAQCSGLPMIVSDTVTTEMKITDLVTFLSIKEPVKRWVEAIMVYVNNPMRINTEKDICNSGYSIKNEAKKLERKYKILVDKNK
ncbi:putative glycosyltransferase EpsF [Clostridium sp. N3C]|uniref:glycosyltransferase family 1 protein n=1 Tax=Clostridium sp. N3C TaxID=1776758 RepID=UPI00092DEB37|nr:glycosyltransferase family 1 protein [Clostridium sp. N3C]SCN26552.1 putative glycosyltransferase EpsF [Clostridium sp. N3C]